MTLFQPRAAAPTGPLAPAPRPVAGSLGVQLTAPGPHPGGADAWRDLAPMIVRQRLVVEGVPAAPIDEV